ncbi:RbsD/FucU domain-containing protein [Sphaerisporangium sp. B11E5]|uniref:RbsD/FucU domain-containing protein n=1 Tax=Sphaerisporangium sp. B11E5 TaxID=3153563 RepID=UPI00325F234D
MLKGVDPVLTPEVLYALGSMGHGDEVVVVDANFPAERAARRSGYGKLLRAEGGGSPRVVRAFCVVATAETRGWGCFILTKGVILAADAPASAGGATIGDWTP